MFHHLVDGVHESVAHELLDYLDWVDIHDHREVVNSQRSGKLKRFNIAHIIYSALQPIPFFCGCDQVFGLGKYFLLDFVAAHKPCIYGGVLVQQRI